LPEILGMVVLRKIMTDNKVELDSLDNTTPMRMVTILSEGKEADGLLTATFYEKYSQISGDKKVSVNQKKAEEAESEQKECVLIELMKQGKKTWAHQLFCTFSNYLKEKNHESIEYLIKDSHIVVDQRGFCSEAEFEKVLRLMDPTLNTTDLEKLKKEFKLLH
jgi:hypothetical protein